MRAQRDCAQGKDSTMAIGPIRKPGIKKAAPKTVARRKATASDEMNQLQTKLSKMDSLPPGWDGYSAPAPSETAITTAKSLLSAFLGEDFAPKRISPSAVGGVGITHKRESRKVYVEIYNSGEVYALFSDGISEPDVRQIEPGYQSFKRLITLMRAYLDA